MGYWTRARVLERLVQLIEDLQLVGQNAIALDTAAGGSVGLPEGEWGTWKGFGLAMAGVGQSPPSHRERMQGHAARLPRADDSDLAQLRSDALWAYTSLHSAVPLVDPWVHPAEPHRQQALALRYRLADAEDEAHRVVSAAGDCRRDLRRARAAG